MDGGIVNDERRPEGRLSSMPFRRRCLLLLLLGLLLRAGHRGLRDLLWGTATEIRGGLEVPRLVAAIGADVVLRRLLLAALLLLALDRDLLRDLDLEMRQVQTREGGVGNGDDQALAVG